MARYLEDRNQSEEIVSFTTRSGIQLNGILHSPKSGQRRTTILFTHSGVRGRIGNTRQFVSYGRQFASRGYHVLRFDPHGMGYSDGHIENSDLNSLYRAVQLGKFVPDTLDAISFIKERLPDNERIVLMGVCGGAITALHATAQSKDVDLVILPSVPVRLERSQVAIGVHTDYARNQIKETYLRKIFSLAAWRRLLTGRSEDFLADLGRVRAIFKAAISKKRQAFPLNQMFVDSIRKINARKVGKLIFLGSNEISRFEFENEFESKYPGMIKPGEKVIIENANHMFSLPCWQQEIMDRSLKWLESAECRQ